MKYLSGLLLLVVILFCCAFSFSDLTDPLYEGVRQQALASFRDLFAEEVKIEKAGGILLGQIVLQGVTIGPDLSAEKVTIDVNPVKFLMNRGDVVPAISIIKVVNGQARIVRNKQGRLNALNFLKPPREGQGAVPFQAYFRLVNCRVDYQDQAGLPYKRRPVSSTIERVEGEVNLTRTPKVGIKLKGRIGEQTAIEIKGSANLKTQKYDLRLTARKLPIMTWGNYAIPYFDFASGQADLDLKIRDSGLEIKAEGEADKIKFDSLTKVVLPQVKVTSRISVLSGEFYQQKFSGQADLLFEDQQLKLLPSRLNLYGGTINLSGNLNLAVSRFALRGEFAKLGLAALKAPGVEGYAAGKAELQGSFDEFEGRVTTRLTNASAFGHPVEEARARIRYRRGDILFEQLRIASAQAAFEGGGTLSRDKDFDFSGRAYGLKFSGEGVLGPMSAHLNNFQGKIAFKLDDEFYKHPLKTITAAGTFEVTRGILGEQEIDSARGDINLTKGEIKIADTYLQRRNSVIFISGKMGLGDNDLRVWGQNLNLADLKVLNYLLPPDAQNLTGQADLDLSVSGKLTELDSLDSLLALKARGQLNIRDGIILKVPVREVSLEARYEDRSLSFSGVRVRTQNSRLAAELSFKKDQTLDLRLSGYLDLSDIKPWLAGTELRGVGEASLVLLGPRDNPQARAAFKIRDFNYNGVKFRSFAGDLSLYDRQLYFLKPLMVDSEENQIQLSGAMVFADPLENSVFNLGLVVKKGELKDLYQLGENLYQQAARFVRPVVSEKIRLSRTGMSFPRPSGKQLYLSDGPRPYFLKLFEGVLDQLEKYRASLVPPSIAKVGGKIKGEVSLTGTFGDPNLKASLTIQNGSYGKYQFGSLRAQATFSRGILGLQQVEVRKGEGRLVVKGQIDLDQESLSLAADSDDFPIDILVLLADRDYSGGADLRATAVGELRDPQIKAEFSTGKIGLAGVEYDRLIASAEWKQGKLRIDRFEIQDAGKVSRLSGFYSLRGEGELQATLEGDAPGLLNLINDEVQWISGKSQGNLNVKISSGRPRLAGWLTISDATLQLKHYDSQVQKGYLQLTADQDQVVLHSLMGYWLGKGTQYKVNFLSLTGRADLKQAQLNVRLADTRLAVDLPNFYRGQVAFRGLSLTGSFDDLNLAGEMELDNGILSLPEKIAAGGPARTSPLNLDLKIDLGQNMYLTGGNVMTLNLSNIFFNMEMYGQGLNLRGNLEKLKMRGKVYFKRGTVNIFNREFVLLNAEQQRQYYPYDLDKQQDNYAQFLGENLLPDLNLIAMVKVEQAKVSETDPTQKEKKETMVISHIRGIPFAAEKERGIDIGLLAYEEDKSKSPPEYRRAGLDDAEIKVLLLPDFIKSLTGIEKGTAVDSNAVVADYLSSRLQTLVFRGVERELEQALGLTSLTLEYNFGSDLRRAMGVAEVSVDRPLWGVGFVKGFFDKLYIDVRYSKWDVAYTAGPEESIHYQVTLKLSPILSVLYYREPLSVYDLQSGPSRTSLNAGFSF
jgi:hypothetical protein